jgi:putative ABC transport system permease protein
MRNNKMTVFQDIRYALRMLRKSPGFTTVAVATLALGIGANALMFSAVDTVILRPLPFPESDRLVTVKVLDHSQNLNVPVPDSVSYPDFFDWRAQNHVFASIAAYHNNFFGLTGVDRPQHLQGEIVSADFFSVLGVSPLLGRGFQRVDEQPGSRVVVLSYDLWQTSFGGDKGIVGHSITLDRQSFTVVGVMPPGFAFPVASPAPQLWTTLAQDAETSDPKSKPMTAQRGATFLRIVARLKNGVTISQARSQMDVLAASLAKQFPDDDGNRTSTMLTPQLEDLIGDVRPALIILLAAVGCILLIACANLANLLLGRATNRTREISVRIALGATRGRIVQQLLTEAVLLSFAGSAAGLALTTFGLRLLPVLAPQDIPRLQHTELNVTVVAFAIILAAVTSIIFGLAPALQSARISSMESLKESTGTVSPDRRHHQLRNWLVIGETALGLVLLVSAGLLLRSFQRLWHVDPGMHPGQMLTFRLDLPSATYSEPQRVQLYRNLMDELQGVPGVIGVAGGAPMPLSNSNIVISFRIDGHPVPPAQEPSADSSFVTPGYFKTLGIPLLAGREFTEHDNVSAPAVIIVNQAFARRFFPNENAIGKRIRPGFGTDVFPPMMREIVGVVGDVKQRGMANDAVPTYYTPYNQGLITSLVICVRSAVDPVNLVPAVRNKVAALDPQVPVYDLWTMDERISRSVSQPRFNAYLLSLFAGLALLLTAVGLYGVMAYTVAQRRREIGLRLALGASRTDVLSMILLQGLRLTGLGLVIGLAGAVVVTSSFTGFTHQLFGTHTFDALTLASVTVLLVLVSLLASYIPAWGQQGSTSHCVAI